MVLYNLRAAAVTATSASVPNSRPWTQTPLLTVAGIAAPVQLPETPYAYVAASSSVAGSSPAERLVRIDLADGQVTKGPALVSGSFLLAIGRQIGVLSPAALFREKGPVRSRNSAPRAGIVHDARAWRRRTGTVPRYGRQRL